MAASRSGRLLRHIAHDHGNARRAFPERALAAIQAAIAAGERRHRGQVCVAIEASLPPARVLRRVTPRERALEVFGQLRVWDTEANSGVLLYVLLADRAVEIVADRGIHRRVGEAEWEAMCRTLEADFRSGAQADGMVRAVARISDLLAVHFPGDGSQANELPDRPTVL